MKASKMLISTLKEAPQEAKIASHVLLLRAGMMKNQVAGVYQFLPLGLRVLHKIENIIREEMDNAGALEILSSAIQPKELFYTAENAQMMTNPELKEYIATQRNRGSGNVQAFETEWWKRWASPIGAFIMTLLGVTLSSKKVRGGMGKNLGVGLTLSALYILFSTVSTTFSVSGVMSPFMSVWLPNFLFLAIGVLLYIRVSK